MQQIWRTILIGMCLATLGSASAFAGDAVVIEIGSTGLALPNNAYSQDKHYLPQDDDLLGRIACLMDDMDNLLVALHALPPELDGAAVMIEPTAAELVGLIDLLLTHSPELTPYRSKLAQQAAQTRQSGAKQDPLVSFKLASFPLPQLDAGDVPMTQYVFGWSQKYEGYGKRGLRRAISSLNEDLTLLELEQRELQVIGELTSLYYDMASTRTRLKALADNGSLLGLILELAERKYALGRTPQADVLKAQVQLSKLEEQRISLAALFALQAEKLRGLVGHSTDFDPDALVLELDYPLPQPVDFSDEYLLEATLQQLPDYLHLDVVAEQQELRVELAHRAYRPDYTLSASYGMRYGKRDFISAGISFPLFTHKAERQDAALQEAYASLDTTARNQAKMENALATRLSTLRIELNRINDLSQLYRAGLVPQAQLALESAIAGYAANQVDLAVVLQAQQTLLSFEVELEQLYIDYLTYLSELQLASAGAFDPVPYLAQVVGTTENDTGAIAQLSDLVSEPEHFVAAPTEPQWQDTLAPTSAAPPINTPFLAPLGLPPSPLATADVDIEIRAGDDESSVEDESYSDAAGDGFYKPFTLAQLEDQHD